MNSHTLYSQLVLSISNMSKFVFCEDLSLIKLTRIEDIKNISNSMLHTEEHHNSKINIGKYVSIALRCHFMLGGNHNYKRVTTWLPFDEYDSENGLLTNGDINIKHDVWIGENVTIMSGITIGIGSVIATNSVVTKDVEPYSIVGGNPAKFIRKRFDDETIDFLLKSNWWDIDPEILRSNQDSVFTEDIEKFKSFIKNSKNQI